MSKWLTESTVLMGYGFCLESNAADTFNMRLTSGFVPRPVTLEPSNEDSPSLVAMRSANQIGSPPSDAPTHSVRLTTDFILGHDQSVDIPISSYSFQPGLLTDVSLNLRTERELRSVDSTRSPPKDATSLSDDLLTRNKLHVLCILIMFFQDRRAAIRTNDQSLPVKPENPKQQYASIYRASQLRILEGVLLALEVTLQKLTSTPKENEPQISSLDNASSQKNRVFRLSDILTPSALKSKSNSGDSIVPRDLLHSLRSIVHKGLGTRDAEKIKRRGGEDFVFTIFVCGLWILWSTDSIYVETNPDTKIQLDGKLVEWIKRLISWYPMPPTGDCHESTSLYHDKDHTSIAELNETATSYLKAVRASVDKHPESIFNSTTSLTIGRMIWCLSVVRGESVRCPVPTSWKNTENENLNESRDNDLDELVMVMEIM